MNGEVMDVTSQVVPGLDHISREGHKEWGLEVYLTKLFGTVDALGLYVSFNTIFSQIGGSDGSHSHRFDCLKSQHSLRGLHTLFFFSFLAEASFVRMSLQGPPIWLELCLFHLYIIMAYFNFDKIFLQEKNLPLNKFCHFNVQNCSDRDMACCCKDKAVQIFEMNKSWNRSNSSFVELTHIIYRQFLFCSRDSLSLVIPNNRTIDHWQLKVLFYCLVEKNLNEFNISHSKLLTLTFL